MAMLNLIRLGRITADAELERKAEMITRCFYESVVKMPSGYTQLMIAVDFALGPSYEVVITGDSDARDTKEMLRSVQKPFLPNQAVIFKPTNIVSDDIQRIAPYIENYHAIDSKATAYVCSNYQCERPTTDINTMLSLLNV